MTYGIAEPCVDVLDRACVQECPVDCAALGSPGGAGKLAPLGVDTALVTAYPRNQE
jgi:hypothetical protein